MTIKLFIFIINCVYFMNHEEEAKKDARQNLDIISAVREGINKDQNILPTTHKVPTIAIEEKNFLGKSKIFYQCDIRLYVFFRTIETLSDHYGDTLLTDNINIKISVHHDNDESGPYLYFKSKDINPKIFQEILRKTEEEVGGCEYNKLKNDWPKERIQESITIFKNIIDPINSGQSFFLPYTKQDMENLLFPIKFKGPIISPEACTEKELTLTQLVGYIRNGKAIIAEKQKKKIEQENSKFNLSNFSNFFSKKK